MQGVLTAGVARRVLRWHLVRMRELANKSQADAAARIGRTQPAIAAVERGTSLPIQSNLEILCQFYGVEHAFPMMRDLLNAAKTAGAGESGPATTTVVEDFTLLVGLEPYAQLIEAYEQVVITGLLQTEAYGRVLLERYASHTPGVDVDRSLQLRMQRQQAITGDDPAELWFFVDEPALRRPVGTPEVMAAQLEHLLAMTEQPHVNMQVLQLAAGPHSALAGSFELVSLRDGLRVAYEETGRSSYYYDASDAVDAYARVVDHLRHEALPPGDSRTMVHQMMKELQQL